MREGTLWLERGRRSLGNDEAVVKLWICDLRGESCQEKSRQERDYTIVTTSINDTRNRLVCRVHLDQTRPTTATDVATGRVRSRLL